MTIKDFEIAAEKDNVIRRPQDHGPLKPAELASRKEEVAITKSHADVYGALCARKGFSPKNG